ncbi:putative VgrG-like protein/endolysin [Dickeya phage vB_DsoM_JA33]|uniref:Putative VgrG-like protein/endolysin n=2 Tax=Salmondvirus JA11 TaxID=2734141 RepID=A0A386K5I9_9CAUD|nr:putative VgrG-like protein/endolysin [Dickeya phage vB_DsoM_JA11]AXG67491.1 putative VgrG-like protein/endolysin [Dickeya phage vB_DsoM_JA33]AYD79922.1 putative VgrG-like protein/endolysin [Dickeya phage vB_DsoM_JA11]
MDASMISEEQLSALELMMSHADDAHIQAQGAPKRKRKKKSLTEMFPEGFEYYEEYVGTGSRKANREMRAQQTTTTRPDNRDVVKALETVFAEQSEDTNDLIKSVDESTSSTKQVAKTLADWLKWTQQRAFLDDHKAKADSSIAPPSTDRDTRGGGGDDGLGVDDLLPDGNGADERGKRRQRNGRRGSRSSRSRLRRMRLGRFGRSRAGKIAGLVALAATGLGAGYLMKSDSSENLEDGHDNYGDENSEQQNPTASVAQPEEATPKPAQTGTEVPRADQTVKPPLTEQQIAEKEEARDKQDAMWDTGTTAALLLAGAKRVPGVGAAVTAADGVYNSYQIAHDDTLSEQEKKKAQVQNITSTGGAATGTAIGMWAGGTIGSIVPVFGTAIGATLGGLLGGYLGDKIGSFVGEKISDETDEAIEEDRKRREKEDQEASLLDNPVASRYAAPIFMPLALGGASPTGAAAGFNYGFGGGGPARFPGQTSQRANDIAQKVLSSEKIGGVSEQFESGGKGVGTVSSGAGDYGGVSYGKHQLASANGSMSQFLASPEAKDLSGEFMGLTPGTAAFNERYRQVAATRGKDMEDAQYQYLVRTHYAPTAEKLEKNLGIDMDKQGRAFKELVYSTSMQYGGNAADKIQRAFRGKDFNSMTEEERIEAIQQDKLANVQNDFRSSSVQVQQGVAARTQRELDVLKKVHEQDKEKQAASAEPVKTEKKEGTFSPDELQRQNAQVEAKPTATGDAPRAETPIGVPQEVRDDARKNAAAPAPAPAAPFEEKSIPEKEAELAKLREHKDFLQRKVAYIKAHPEVTRDDDKKINEIIRNQQVQAGTVTANKDPESTSVRSESLATKEQVSPEVERVKPLEEMPAPAAAPVTETASTTPSGGGARSSGSSGGGARSSGSPSSGASSPSLDDIPVILEDPMLNLINVGYV